MLRRLACLILAGLALGLLALGGCSSTGRGKRARPSAPFLFGLPVVYRDPYPWSGELGHPVRRRRHNRRRSKRIAARGKRPHPVIPVKGARAPGAVAASSPSSRPHAAAADGVVRAYRLRVARLARGSVGRRRIACGPSISYRADCSGWVRCIYSHLRLDVLDPGPGAVGNGVFRIRTFVKRYGRLHRGVPAPGDIVFWHHTYDKNRNGRLDDRWTHTGIVEAVEEDGRVSVIHKGVRTGISRVYMHLGRPGVYRVRVEEKPGEAGSGRTSRRPGRQRRYRVLNSYLIGNRWKHRNRGRLTGQLFAAYGTVIKRPLPAHLDVPSVGTPVAMSGTIRSLLLRP